LVAPLDRLTVVQKELTMSHLMAMDWMTAKQKDLKMVHLKAVDLADGMDWAMIK